MECSDILLMTYQASFRDTLKAIGGWDAAQAGYGVRCTGGNSFRIMRSSEKGWSAWSAGSVHPTFESADSQREQLEKDCSSTHPQQHKVKRLSSGEFFVRSRHQVNTFVVSAGGQWWHGELDQVIKHLARVQECHPDDLLELVNGFFTEIEGGEASQVFLADNWGGSGQSDITFTEEHLNISFDGDASAALERVKGQMRDSPGDFSIYDAYWLPASEGFRVVISESGMSELPLEDAEDSGLERGAILHKGTEWRLRDQGLFSGVSSFSMNGRPFDLSDTSPPVHLQSPRFNTHWDEIAEDWD